MLGLNQILSGKSLRRALSVLAPNQPPRSTEAERARRLVQLTKSTAWIDAALTERLSEALKTPWILDCDTTVKPFARSPFSFWPV